MKAWIHLCWRVGLWLILTLYAEQAAAQTPAEYTPDAMVQDVIFHGTDIVDLPAGTATHFLVEIEIHHSDDVVGRCTGVSIAANVVLTAGHCLLDVTKIMVKFPTTTSPLDFEVIAAASWRRHPAYNGGYGDERLLKKLDTPTASRFHDIGLIVLDRPSDYAEPITLAPPDFDPGNDSKAWMFVFGQGRDDLHLLNGRLEFAELIALSKMGNSALYKAAMAGDQAWCQADSGGPVTIVGDADNPSHDKVHFLLGIAFAYFDIIKGGDIEAMEAIWGSVDTMPNCGGRLAFTLIGPELSWIRQTLRDLLPDEEIQLKIFGMR